MNNKTTTFGRQGIWLLNKVLVPVTMFALSFLFLASCSKDKTVKPVKTVKEVNLNFLVSKPWKTSSIAVSNDTTSFTDLVIGEARKTNLLAYADDGTYTISSPSGFVKVTGTWNLSDDGLTIYMAAVGDDQIPVGSIKTISETKLVVVYKARYAYTSPNGPVWYDYQKESYFR